MQELCVSGMASRILSIKLRLLCTIFCICGSSTSALLSGTGALRADVAMKQGMAKAAREEKNQDVTAFCFVGSKCVRVFLCQAVQRLALSPAAPLRCSSGHVFPAG